MTELRLFTSESVTEGHPDKICDQISDSILDALLAKDPSGRVAVETLVTTGLVHVAGEVRTEALRRHPGDRPPGRQPHRLHLERHRLRRRLVRRQHLDRRAVPRHRRRRRQRVRAPRGRLRSTRSTSRAPATRASCSATPRTRRRSSCRWPIWTAHRMAERLAEVRRTRRAAVPAPRRQDPGHARLRRLHVPKTVETVVLSTQHHPDISQDDAARRGAREVIDPVLATTGPRPRPT